MLKVEEEDQEEEEVQEEEVRIEEDPEDNQENIIIYLHQFLLFSNSIFFQHQYT